MISMGRTEECRSTDLGSEVSEGRTSSERRKTAKLPIQNLFIRLLPPDSPLIPCDEPMSWEDTYDQRSSFLA
jgi:hypothetical protein